MMFKVVKKKRWTKRIISDNINPEILQKVTKMSELILKEDVLDCFHDWIDRYGCEHTADEDPVYQRIEALDVVRRYDEDCISRRVAIDAIDDIESEVTDGFGFQYEKWRKYFCELPAVQPDHVADISKKAEKEDCISRQAAIDLFPNDALEWDTKGGYIAPHLARQMICELPSAQPDHNADVSKKVSISCGHENDVISRQAARHALCKAVHKGEDIPCENQTASCLWTGTRVCDYVREIDALPTVQPEQCEWIPKEVENVPYGLWWNVLSVGV